VGFVGAHDGRTANFVFVDWWAGEDELHHHTWLSSNEEPGRLRPTGPDDLAACAWDLAVIGHERTAWVRHVLARAQGPDLDAYLADRLDGEI
jgi:prepilin-type processing-associated H-X9-DG protein